MEGAPAIQPHLDTIPAFTEDDVRAYFATHSFMNIRISCEGSSVVKKVLFMTSTETSALLQGAYVSSLPDKQVCYVELSGDFLFVGGPPPSTVTRLDTVHAVFDAETGNLLMQGTR